MNRSVKFVIWFPIILVIAFAAGYLFWQKTLIPGPYDLEPVSIARNSNSSPSDISGWQTYRNEIYGFEFKYPADVSLTEDPNSINILINFQKPDGFNITLIKAETSWVNDPLYFFDANPKGSIIIGENKWYEYLLPQGYGDGPGGDGLPLYGLQTLREEVLIRISFHNQKELTKLQHQILSTFKFIN